MYFFLFCILHKNVFKPFKRVFKISEDAMARSTFYVTNSVVQSPTTPLLSKLFKIVSAFNPYVILSSETWLTS